MEAEELGHGIACKSEQNKPKEQILPFPRCLAIPVCSLKGIECMKSWIVPTGQTQPQKALPNAMEDDVIPT
jgi:hypothetical protein